MASGMTRREAIGIGVAGVSAAVATRARASGEDTGRSNGKLGFAVVGIGKLALGEIIPALHKTENAYRCLTEPLNIEAMRRVRSGSLGKPRLVITKMVRQSSLSEPSDAWRLDMKMSGGGALADMGIYGINGSRYLLNEEPVEVRATSQTDRSDPRFQTVEDLYSWEFKFPSGAIAQGSTSFDASDTMAYEVYGEQKRIVADPGCFYGGNHLSLVQGGSRTEIPIHEIDHFAREMDWMADVVRGKKPMLAPGEEGLQDMRLIRAIMESAAKNGAPVSTTFGYRRAVDPVAAIPA